jgi:hypothetical protein
MNIKTFIAAAVISLTAACTAEPEVPAVEAELNENVVAEAPIKQLELNEDAEVNPREVNEDNPTGP